MTEKYVHGQCNTPQFIATKHVAMLATGAYLMAAMPRVKPLQCTVKVKTDEIKELKSEYRAVGKPYNFSQEQWVSLTFGMDMTDTAILEMIKYSYNLVKK